MSSPGSFQSEIGRIGGYAVHARHDSNEIAARARAGLDARFEREVVEHATAQGETLTTEQIASRTYFARKAYFARISLKAAQTRAKKASR